MKLRNLSNKSPEEIVRAFEGELALLGRMQTMQVESLPTGLSTLDDALGVKGLPLGRIVEVYGGESEGKTSLALAIAARAQQAGGKAAFLDIEHSLNLKTAKGLGVDLDNLLFNQPDSAEGALELVKRLLETHAANVIIVDSVAALTPESQEERDVGDAIPGRRALLLSNTLPILAKLANQSGTILIFINQIRYKIGVRWGSPVTTPGGNALKFFASMRLQIKRLDTIKTNGKQIGHRVCVTVVKNKMAMPFRKAFLRLDYGKSWTVEDGKDEE